MADEKLYQPRQFAAPITVGQTESDALVMRDLTILGLYLPANLTGTVVKFKACYDEGGTYAPVYKDDGTEYAVTVAAGIASYVPIDPSVLAGAKFVKVVSNATQTGSAAAVVVASGRVL